MCYICSLTASQPMIKCRRVFQSLINISIEELCEIADSLISPVRMGVARPTAPFSLVGSNIDAIQGSEELFSIDPLPPLSSTIDPVSDSVAYIPRPQPMAPSVVTESRPRDRDRDRDEDELDPAGPEEVSIITVNKCNVANFPWRYGNFCDKISFCGLMV